MQNCQKLAGRFEQKAKEGLIDVKFYVGNAQEATSEQICQEVEGLFEAVERGEFAKLDFKKRRA